ncbi:MAG: radical SAM family heme chaperone HemW [Chloroflexaceae bacterium]|nr:radical SAM family heme chaperone HemW [Chloroflexaceae bacterium]
MHLYIHIPFCRRRCTYCGFCSSAGLEHRLDAYVRAVCAELAALREDVRIQTGRLSSSLDLRPTIFLGGGTPSLLSPAQVGAILQAASALVPLEQAEITLEANPGTLMGPVGRSPCATSLAYFRSLRTLGVNRLSLGVQSLHDPTLRILGRLHTAAEARQCVDDASRAGFQAINLDFIFGLPGQTCADWATTLDTVAAWDINHLSLYSLILEEHTALFAQVMRGEVDLPDHDTTAAMYELAMERLAGAGFVHYELSNWARASRGYLSPRWPSGEIEVPLPVCHHNVAYWLNVDYLGVGAGGHGHIYPERYANLTDLDAYLAAVQQGRRPVEVVTPLSPSDLAAETMFMGLRLVEGVRFAHFRCRCGVEMEAVYGEVLRELEGLGLLERTTDAVRLTNRGRMLGNQVFASFL